MPDRKKIVYLLGAGATHAEILLQGVDAKTLMGAISENVLKMSESNGGLFYKLHNDQGIPSDQDIEQLMSLFQGYDEKHSDYLKVYNEIRKLFREYLISQIISKNVKPFILISLIHLYKRYGVQLNEDLTAVFTTNYDTLLDCAFKDRYGGINLGYSFKGDNIGYNGTSPLLIKLHGSFNWEIKNYELYVKDDTNISSIDPANEGWIPPSVFKKPNLDLYKAIWHKAKEALKECDILRVVGCSLRNEDISLLSLIFTAQLSRGAKPFRVEFIDFEKHTIGDDTHKGIIGRLAFLANPTPFSSIEHYDKSLDFENTEAGNPFYSLVRMLIKYISENDPSINDDTILNTNLKLI